MRSVLIGALLLATPAAQALPFSKCELGLYNSSMQESDRWREYNRAGNEQPARPRVIKTLELLTAPGRALDLGAGGGRDSRELLKHGWAVEAVDNSPQAVALLKHMAEEFPNRLTVVTSNFEVLQLEPGNYDLITGSYSLPFCQPKEFARFWAQLIKALKPGGLISVELFGVQDTWNGPGKKMTFLTRTQVDELVRDMTVVTLNEEEYDGGTFSGEQKHWHLFTLIAKARE